MLLYLHIPEYLHTLDSEELKLAQSHKLERNQLLFAVVIKFFQAENRYPTKKDGIDPAIIASLSNQLNVSSTLFEQSLLESLTVVRFRIKIRKLLGYRQATLIAVSQTCHKNGLTDMPQKWSYRYAT